MASPAPDPDATRAEQWRFFKAMLGASAFLSVYLGAWAAVVVAILLGPYLASGVQMLGGNLQPRFPAADWPVLLTALCAAAPVPLAARQRWLWASLATLPLVGVVGWALWRMYLSSGVGAVYQ